MKVVLFCGGLGTRLRDHSDTIPKPLVNIGYRPIVWHLMRYYAHFGHKEFVLCLGYRGDLVREYFLSYREELTNDFVLHAGTGKVELLSSDVRTGALPSSIRACTATSANVSSAPVASSKRSRCSSRITLTDSPTFPWTR